MSPVQALLFFPFLSDTHGLVLACSCIRLLVEALHAASMYKSRVLPKETNENGCMCIVMYRDNVALGSEGHGFRIQSSSSTLTCQLPVAASFQDNAAHSNQGHGLLMDPPCEAANLDSKDLPGVSMLIDSYQA